MGQSSKTLRAQEEYRRRLRAHQAKFEGTVDQDGE
jgi:hypothetical protein